MRITRLYTGDDGISHFEDVDVDLEDYGEMGQMSGLWRGPGVIFRQVDGDYDLDFHVAPRRQLVVNLTGAVEIDTGQEARIFDAGSIMLAEDTTGKGHISRNVDGRPRSCLFIPLADGVGPPAGRSSAGTVA